MYQKMHIPLIVAFAKEIVDIMKHNLKSIMHYVLNYGLNGNKYRRNSGGP